MAGGGLAPVEDEGGLGGEGAGLAVRATSQGDRQDRARGQARSGEVVASLERDAFDGAAGAGAGGRAGQVAGAAGTGSEDSAHVGAIGLASAAVGVAAAGRAEGRKAGGGNALLVEMVEMLLNKVTRHPKPETRPRNPKP